MRAPPSLNQTWTALVLFAVLGPVALAITWAGVRIYDADLRNVLSAKREQNESHRSSIEAEVRELNDLLVRESGLVAHRLQTSPRVTLLPLLEGIREREGAIEALVILAPNGSVIASVPEGSFWFSKGADVPEIAIPMAGRSYVGSPRGGEDRPSFSMAVPLGFPSQGALVAIVNVEPLFRLSTESSSTDYLLNRRGALVTTVPGSTRQPGDLMTDLEIVRSSLLYRDWDQQNSYRGVLGKRVYGTNTLIPTLNWTLVSEVTTPSVVDPIVKDLLRFLVLLGVLLIGFIVLILRLSRRTLRPIQQTCKAIDRVAGGDFDVRLDTSGVRELDLLASGFNAMTDARGRSERELLEREKEVAVLLKNLTVAVLTIDQHGMVLSFNPAAEAVFECDAEVILGKNINVLMPEPNRSKHDQYLNNYVETGDAKVIGIGRDTEGLRTGGEVFPMRLSVAELPAVDGVRRFVGSCHDLSLARKHEEQLRHSQRMQALGNLTGGISHDFNNVLMAIMGYSDILVREIKDPGLLAIAEGIFEASKRADGLTSRLQNFSRSNAADPESVDINARTLSQEDLLRKTLTARVDLHIREAPEVWRSWINGGELDDAILNICINAMHAIGDKGSILIEVKNETLSPIDAGILGIPCDDYVLIRIQDDGSGMDAETRERIFEPFFTTKGDRGTGLGLAQVYAFAERSGGTISVTSTLGVGTEFTLYLPRLRSGGSVSQEVGQTELEPELDVRGTETILVVDDEVALQTLSRIILEKNGYRVLSASSGTAALELLKTEPVALMISDIIMPGMDGFQLSALVKQEHPEIRIQLASGYADEEHADLVDESLRENQLRKPYVAETLLRRVRELLDEPTCTR